MICKISQLFEENHKDFALKLNEIFKNFYFSENLRPSIAGKLAKWKAWGRLSAKDNNFGKITIGKTVLVNVFLVTVLKIW